MLHVYHARVMCISNEMFVSVICAAYRNRKIQQPCQNRPPGKGQRHYCHDCRRFEHYCRAYDRKTGEFCPQKVIGVHHYHCNAHNAYNKKCAACIVSVIPQNFFCRHHQYLTAEANTVLNSSSQNYKLRNVCVL